MSIKACPNWGLNPGPLAVPTKIYSNKDIIILFKYTYMQENCFFDSQHNIHFNTFSSLTFIVYIKANKKSEKASADFILFGRQINMPRTGFGNVHQKQIPTHHVLTT